MNLKRMLGYLLSLMLVVTTLPMVVLAEEEVTYNSMEEVVSEFVGLTDYSSYAYFSMMEKIPNGTPGFTYTPYNSTIDPEKGTYIDSSATSMMFRYNSGVDYWSPLEAGKRFAYFKAQVSETDRLEIYVEDSEDKHLQGSFIISANEYGENAFGGKYYAREGGAGTDMMEYLVINDNANVVKLFTKGEKTDGKWVLAVNAYGWTGSNENRGFYFAGTGYVKDITLYGETVTYESLEEIVGKGLYSTPNYEINTETTTATGERYTGPVGPSISEGMVPAFRAMLDDETSSMRIIVRRPGETSANTASYEFTVTPDGIKPDATLGYFNVDFKPGTDYVDYALLATGTECKVYAKSDSQFDGKWVQLLTDRTVGSSDISYHASPVIWATTGSFTVENLTIYQKVKGYETMEDVVGFEHIATKRFDLTQTITDKTGFIVAPTNAVVDAENGTLIDSGVTNGMFRYSNGQEYWSSLETGKRFVYFTAKAYENEALEVIMQNVDGRPSRGSFKISATEFKESGFVNETEFSRDGGAGTDWVEYLLVSTNANYVNLYAKSPSLTNGEWVLACTASGWAGSAEKNNGIYFAGKGYIKEVVLYEMPAFFDSLDEIAGEKLLSISSYEMNTETTVPEGERFTASRPLSVEEGMIPVFRAKLDDAISTMRVIMRKPGETAANTACYEFTIGAETITSNASLSYLNEEFKAGTGYVDYALVATTTECKVYAKSDSQFDGKWVHIITDMTASSTDTSYYATPAIRATTGSFTVQNCKIYQGLETYDSLEDIAGENLYSITNYENNEETTVATGTRYMAGRQLSIEEGMVPVFRAKLDSADSSMRVILRRPGETVANATNYEFTIGPEEITANAALSFVNTEFKAGTGYVDYALFATTTECKVYAKSDTTEGKWVHVLTDTTPSSTDTSYNATPAIWATTGTFTVQNLKIYQGVVGYDSLDAITGLELAESYAKKLDVETICTKDDTDSYDYRYTNSEWGTKLVAGEIPVVSAKVAENSSMTIIGRPSGDTETNTFGYEVTITPDGISSKCQISYLFSAFVPGTDYADYAIIETEKGFALYAKGDESQFDGKWIRILEGAGRGNTSNPYYASPAVYADAGTVTIKGISFYSQAGTQAETYDSLEAIADESLYSMMSYENSEEMTVATGERYTGMIGPSIEDGMIPTFRVKLNDAESSMLVAIRRPGETSANTTSYEFTISPTTITANAKLDFVNTGFKAGLGDVEYALFATRTECKVYARAEGQFEGKWVHILTDTTPSSTDTSYGASPAIWATTGSFTVGDYKIYHPVDTFETMADVVGAPVVATYNFDLKTGFDGVLQGTAKAGEPTFGEDGMLLDAQGEGWRFSHISGYSPLDNGGVVTFRAKVSDGAIIRAMMKSPFNDNQTTWIDISEDTVIPWSEKTTGGVQFEFAPGTDFVDYLVKVNTTGYDVYVKSAATNNQWRLYSNLKGYKSDGNCLGTGLRFYLKSNSGSGYIKDARIYTTENVVVEGETIPATATNLLFEDDFSGKRDYRKTALYSFTEADSLVVSATTESSGYGVYEAMRNSIPAGGYAEFKVMGNSRTGIYFSDGTSILTLGMAGFASSVGIDDVATGITLESANIPVGDGGNSYRIWRIVRNMDGTYTGYCRLEDETVWYKAFENVAATEKEGSTRIGLIKYGIGEVAKLDYLNVYGPLNVTEELSLIDGMGNNSMIVDGGMATADYSTMTALVKQGDVEKTLIIAEYSKTGLLSKLTTEVIPAGSEVTSLIYDRTVGEVKVFLWNGLDNLISLRNATQISYKK